MSWDASYERPENDPDRIMDAGWKWIEFPDVQLRPPIDWHRACSSHRGWQLNLQAWDALGSVLEAYERLRDARYLRFAVELALDWIATHPSRGTGAPLAWYDAAVGLRAYRLAYIADATARDERYSDAEVMLLLEAVVTHAEVLADDASFSGHTNHGFYQVAGQLGLAARFPTLPNMRTVRRKGFERLRELISTQLTEEGVHREHSPDYHYIVFLLLEGALRSFIESDPCLSRMRDRIEEALAWFVLPNQRLAMFGDSFHRLMARGSHIGHEHPSLRFVFSGGKQGRPPAARLRAFPKSGYVVMRDRWPSGQEDFAKCSYLAQSCAFHSRTHKHADDLSFIWYDRGSELLVDSGRYGYGERTPPGSQLYEAGFYYSDPRRIYVESTRAHNTVEIDERSYRRRGVRPYGSALTAWGEADGLLYAESSVSHDDVHHHRVLVFHPCRWVLVLDNLEDTADQPHHFAQRFNFAPELEVESDGDCARLSVPGETDLLHVVPLLPAPLEGPARGIQDPRLLGWISRADRQLTATSTIAYIAHDTVCHSFATVLAFAPERPVAVAADELPPDFGEGARYVWELADSLNEVRLSRDQCDRVRVSYRRVEPP